MLSIWVASKNLSVHNIIGKYGCQTIDRCIEMKWSSQVFDLHARHLVVQLLTESLETPSDKKCDLPMMKTKYYRAQWLLRILTEGMEKWGIQCSAALLTRLRSNYGSNYYLQPVDPNFRDEVERFKEKHDKLITKK